MFKFVFKNLDVFEELHEIVLLLELGRALVQRPGLVRVQLRRRPLLTSKSIILSYGWMGFAIVREGSILKICSMMTFLTCGGKAENMMSHHINLFKIAWQ